MPKNQHKEIMVRKASGDQQPFSSNKLGAFLQRIQVPEIEITKIVESVANEAKPNTSTAEIAHHVTQLLQQIPDGTLYCARYNLKPAIRRLGPEGHNFEAYVGRLFEAAGFKVKTGTIEQGKCVDHEVDVVATKENEYHYVECKFHNREGIKSDVVVTLYTFARFDDIHNNHASHDHIDVGWLATNTKLTSQALRYIECRGMKLLSVEQPAGDSIMDKVINEGLFPISSVSVLEPYIKELLQAELVLLEDIQNITVQQAHRLGIPKAILQEAKAYASEVLKQI